MQQLPRVNEETGQKKIAENVPQQQWTHAYWTERSSDEFAHGQGPQQTGPNQMSNLPSADEEPGQNKIEKNVSLQPWTNNFRTKKSHKNLAP